eukprot:superscaffoldBa00001869_g12320
MSRQPHLLLQLTQLLQQLLALLQFLPVVLYPLLVNLPPSLHPHSLQPSLARHRLRAYLFNPLALLLRCLKDSCAAGLAKTKWRAESPVTAAPQAIKPKPSAQKQLVACCFWSYVCLPPSNLSPSPPPASGRPALKARFDKRRVGFNTCRKCGQFRTAETGHSQYQGIIYYPSTETMNKELQLEQI